MANDPTNGVTTTEVMAAPMISDAYAKRDYPMLAQPEAVHARLWGDKENGEYHLNYNGCDIVYLSVKSEGDVRVRCYSDGNFQSTPFAQQFHVQARMGARVRVAFHLPCEMICMRPGRAANGQAVLGQVGRPLIYGVNGLYALKWDLLISWHGFDFTWQDSVIQEKDGEYTAVIETNAAVRPLMILLRPKYYAEHLGYKGFAPWIRRMNEASVAGWCSWEAFHTDVTQDLLAQAAKCLSPLRPYGLRYMQLDDGFEMPLLPETPHGTVTDAWTRCNDHFPGGHEKIVGVIRQYGFEPGLWVCPNITNMATAAKSGYCLQTENGPLFGDWIRGVIDCLPETLNEQVVPCYRKLREMGYAYIKIDGMRHLTYDGMQEAVRRGLMTGEDAFNRVKAYVTAARKGLGEQVYLLSCWGVITPAIGMADGMRVSTDAYPRWCAFSMQLYDTARWFFAQRVLFTIDPDHVCVRAPYPWARMMLSLVSLSGGLYMISDPPESYDDTRMELMKKTLPPLPTRAAETGPVDLTIPTCARSFQGYDDDALSRDITYIEKDDAAPFSSLWAYHMAHGGRVWCVLQRCGITALPETRVSMKALALDPQKTYYAFDFWQQKPLGQVRENMVLPALALGDTLVIALCDISSGLPCLIASDRHVSMDAVSVQEAVWQDGAFEMKLKGFAGLTVCYTLYNGGQALKADFCHGVCARCENTAELTRLDVTFEQEEAVVRLCPSKE